MNTDAKNLQIQADYIQHHIKKIIHLDQVEFLSGMQGLLNVCKPINVMHHVSKLKNKHHIMISINAEKTFDKL